MSELPTLNLDQFLSADDGIDEVKPVPLPEINGKVYVRRLSALERDRWELGNNERSKSLDGGGIRARFAALVMCDENGAKLVKNMRDPRIEKMAKKSSRLLDRIWEVGMEFNGMREEEYEENPTSDGSETTQDTDDSSS